MLPEKRFPISLNEIMRHKDRVMAAFRGEVPDRVGTFEQVFSSSVASAILGRTAYTGSTSLHFHEAQAWMRGEQAHAEFVAQVYEDTLAIHKQLDLDAMIMPWRFTARPARQIDEYTFLYGDERTGDWYKMSFAPASQTYGEVARGKPLTLENVTVAMKAVIDSVAAGKHYTRFSTDDMIVRAVKEYGEEYAIAGSAAAIGVPIQEAWLQATILERELVEDYLDARVEVVILRLRGLKAIGVDFINGGADFADKNGPIYSPTFFTEIMAPRWKRIIDECRRLDLPYVMRSDGNLWPVAQEMFGRVRPHAYGEVDWEAGMDPHKLRTAFPELTLFGNVPCGTVLIQGTPDEVSECTRYIIRSAAPRLVLGSSNALLHGTPPENVYAMLATAREYSAALYAERARGAASSPTEIKRCNIESRHEPSIRAAPVHGSEARLSPRAQFLCALRGGVPDRMPYFEYSISRNVVAKAFGRCPTDPLEFNRLVGKCDLEVWRKPPIFAQYATTPDGHQYVTGGLIQSRADYDKLFRLPDPLKHGKARPDPAAWDDAARQVAGKGEFAIGLVISLSADPMLLSMGFEGFAYTLADDPGLIGEIMDRYADWTIQVLEEYQKLDFDFVLCGDDLAHKTAPFVSAETFHEILFPRMKRVAQAIRVPWILHSDGNLQPIWQDLMALGMSGLNPIEPGAMDIFELKRTTAGKLALVGNFDINILALGTPEQVWNEVRTKVQALAPGGGYVAASSNSIPDYVKPENFRAMVEAIAEASQTSGGEHVKGAP